MFKSVSEMPDELSDEKKTELWREFHKNNLFGPTYKAAFEQQAKLLKIQGFYDTDDIFRREIDGIKERMQKKKIKLKDAEKKIEELGREAEFRHYIATFEQMKQNFEARKGEMAKIKNAFT